MYSPAFKYPTIYGKTLLRETKLEGDLLKKRSPNSFIFLLRALDMGKKEITNEFESLFPEEKKELLEDFFISKFIFAYSTTPVLNDFLDSFEKHTLFFLEREKDSDILKIAVALGSDLRLGDYKDKTFSLSLFDYISASHKRTDSLVYKDLELGRVFLSREELISYLVSKISSDFLKKIPQRAKLPKYFEAYGKTLNFLSLVSKNTGLSYQEAFSFLKEEGSIRKIVDDRKLQDRFFENLRKKLPREKAERLRETISRKISFVNLSLKSRFPPCVEIILRNLEAGENLPHNQRFFIACFLSSLGFSKQDIVSLFEKTPNFDKHITEYQVEYVMKNKYKPFDCSKVRQEGFCFEQPICKNAKNPLTVQTRIQREKTTGFARRKKQKSRQKREDKIWKK